MLLIMEGCRGEGEVCGTRSTTLHGIGPAQTTGAQAFKNVKGGWEHLRHHRTDAARHQYQCHES